MPTVEDVMLHTPRTCGPETTVAQARAVFADDHIHAVLVVDGPTLVSVVERADLEGADPEAPVSTVGALDDRVIGPGGDAEDVRLAMAARRQRRLAVVDHDGTLLGLLCLKRSGRGFCSAEDVAAREAERAARRVEHRAQDAAEGAAEATPSASAAPHPPSGRSGPTPARAGDGPGW